MPSHPDRVRRNYESDITPVFRFIPLVFAGSDHPIVREILTRVLESTQTLEQEALERMMK